MIIKQHFAMRVVTDEAEAKFIITGLAQQEDTGLLVPDKVAMVARQWPRL